MQIYLNFILFFCLLIHSFNAQSEFNENVMQLSESSYYNLIEKLTPTSDSIVFAMFFAPWCGHCKHFKSTWNELADFAADNKESINLTVVAILWILVNVEDIKKLLQQFEIKSIPTLKIFYKGKSYAYDSQERDLASLKKFAQLNFLNTEGTELPQKPSFIDIILEKSSEYLNKVLMFVFQNPIAILGGFICFILSIIAILLSRKTSANQILIEKIENAIESDEDENESKKQDKKDQEKEKKNQ